MSEQIKPIPEMQVQHSTLTGKQYVWLRDMADALIEFDAGADISVVYTDRDNPWVMGKCNGVLSKRPLAAFELRVFEAGYEHGSADEAEAAMYDSYRP